MSKKGQIIFDPAPDLADQNIYIFLKEIKIKSLAKLLNETSF